MLFAWCYYCSSLSFYFTGIGILREADGGGLLSLTDII